MGVDVGQLAGHVDGLQDVGAQATLVSKQRPLGLASTHPPPSFAPLGYADGCFSVACRGGHQGVGALGQHGPQHAPNMAIARQRTGVVQFESVLSHASCGLPTKGRSLPLGRQPNRRRSLDPSAAKVLAIPLGRPRARLGFARCASASTAIVGSTEGEVARRTGFGRGRRRGPAPSFFAVNDVSDSMTWRVRGVRKTSPTHRGWSVTDVWGDPRSRVSSRPRSSCHPCNKRSMAARRVNGDAASPLLRSPCKVSSWAVRMG